MKTSSHTYEGACHISEGVMSHIAGPSYGVAYRKGSCHTDEEVM